MATPAPLGEMKTRIVAELALVHRENRFSPAFRDESTGGIYEHNLARRLGLAISGRGSDEDAIRADTFWRALDALRGEGVITRHVRMEGFEFKSVRLSDAGLRQALRTGVLAPEWEAPENELRPGAESASLTALNLHEWIETFPAPGHRLPPSRADVLSPPPSSVAVAFRNLMLASEGIDLGEGHPPVSPAPDWLFPQGRVALTLVRLSPGPTRVAERAADRWEHTIAARLAGHGAAMTRRLVVVAGLAEDSGWLARRRLAAEIAALMAKQGRLEPRLDRPGLFETRRLTITPPDRSALVGAGAHHVDVYYPAPGDPGRGDAPRVIALVPGARPADALRAALTSLAEAPRRAAIGRDATPPGWRRVLGMWVADAATAAEDALTSWWSAIVSAAQLRTAAAAHDEGYLFWPAAGATGVRLAGANLIRLDTGTDRGKNARRGGLSGP